MSKICKNCDVLETNDNNDYCGICANKLVADLEAKLAEKDKEILDVKNWWSYQYNGEIERHNQDKISFAVEQLEKVKEHILSGLAFDIDVQMWFEEYIDNQIAELKRRI